MEVVAPIPRGLSLTTVSLVLLLCVMAQLSYVDHVVASFEPAVGSQHGDGHQHSGGDEHGKQKAEQHALHCHEGLATCSDLPLAAGPGQLLVGEDLIQPALMSDLELDVLGDLVAPADALVSPPPPPPRAVL